MKKIATLLASLALLGSGLFVAASPVQADPSGLSTSPVAPQSATAYTHATYVVKGLTSRVINVQCHSTGTYRAVRAGQTTEQVCGGTGWINGAWVDTDVVLKVRNDVTGNVTVYPYGYRGSIGPGSYNMCLWTPQVTDCYPNAH